MADHELQNNWTIVHHSTATRTAKPTQAIWSFKRQQWGTNYWETYSLVVKLVTVCLILLLAQIYKLDSKAIDFVLALPQAELDVDIWMYLQIGFHVDTENESKSYILKLNKSLYGLKQASLNWFKKAQTRFNQPWISPISNQPLLIL